MAMKAYLAIACLLAALLSGAMLANELWQLHETRSYNTAIAASLYDQAAPLKGEHGAFAKAYAAHSAAAYQDARVIYGQLASSAAGELRKAALFNLGNTYLEQAQQIDMDSNPDLVLPLIELAKESYRELLLIDSTYWPAKFNLERALRLLPDAREEKLLELDGLRGAIRTVISGDTEENLP